jgi:hypothetical protein
MFTLNPIGVGVLNSAETFDRAPIVLGMLAVIGPGKKRKRKQKKKRKTREDEI